MAPLASWKDMPCLLTKRPKGSNTPGRGWRRNRWNCRHSARGSRDLQAPSPPAISTLAPNPRTSRFPAPASLPHSTRRRRLLTVQRGEKGKQPEPLLFSSRLAAEQLAPRPSGSVAELTRRPISGAWGTSLAGNVPKLRRLAPILRPLGKPPVPCTSDITHVGGARNMKPERYGVSGPHRPQHHGHGR